MVFVSSNIKLELKWGIGNKSRFHAKHEKNGALPGETPDARPEFPREDS